MHCVHNLVQYNVFYELRFLEPGDIRFHEPSKEDNRLLVDSDEEEDEHA